MEFYYVFEIKTGKIEKFQFPTGWNSTPRDALNAEIGKGFNSQRDGILLRLRDISCYL